MNRRPDSCGPRIFTTCDLAQGYSVELEEAPSRHLAAALRLQTGAPVVLFNGTGGEYAGTIASLSRKSVTVDIDRFTPEQRESTLAVSLGLAVSRGERMDYAIQKTTELGIRHIIPLLTERTEVKLSGERLQRKRQHWQQVALSACEQCGLNRPPEVHSLQPLEQWLAGTDTTAGTGTTCKLVLHHRSRGSLAELPRPAGVTLLVGPEGGLTATEIARAEAAEFMPWTLGPRILRTETAPVAALSVLQYIWGDLG